MTDETSDDRTRVALACQGGGSHTAFTAGVLDELFAAGPDVDVVGFSGTSGGAICALLAWYGREHPDHEPGELLLDFWAAIAARDPAHYTANAWMQGMLGLKRGGAPIPEFSPSQLAASAWGHREVRRLLERFVDFERARSLAGEDAPALLVSAIDVLSGESRLFREDEIAPEAILASTAEPNIFDAVEYEGRYYWDGLFASNPPVQAFSTTEDIADPDEVWVIKINPQQRPRVPKRLDGIHDRRNELSGNLALNAEVGFIQQVNEWIDEGYLPDRYTHTDIERIRFKRDLNWMTKLDRSPEFLQTIIEDGRERARTFLENR